VSVANPVASLTSQADRVAADLIEYLRALPRGGWAGPSDCAGWTVAAVVGHLVLVEELLGGSISRGLSGDSGPAPQAAGGPDAWREYRSREIARLGGLPPAELVDQLAAGLNVMDEALGRLATAEATAGPRRAGWHPTRGIQPLAWFAGQWLVEIALHDWDIRVAGDPAAELNTAALPGLGPEMRDRMPVCFKPGPAAKLAGIVRIELDGPSPLDWLARLGDGALTLLGDGADEPDATIRTDPGAYALAQTRRRPAAAFKARGRWRVSGDGALAEGLAAAFAGY
jgi:uncharacterized protein (TIGR03083 family)